MITVKQLLAVCAVTGLAACEQPPLVSPEVASALVVQDVSVGTANFAGVGGREITVPVEQVKADIEAALRRQLVGRGAVDGTAVNVDADIQNIALVSPGQALLIGGVSSITAVVTVTDLSTGATILAPTTVRTTSEGWAPGGVIAAASRGTPQDDYRQTVGAFAAEVTRRIFGESAAAQPASSTTPAANTRPVENNDYRPSAWQL